VGGNGKWDVPLPTLTIGALGVKRKLEFGDFQTGEDAVDPRELVCFRASLIVHGMWMSGGTTFAGHLREVSGWGESEALPSP
jgi:hypothetical protein